MFNKSTTPKDFLNRFLNVMDIDDSVLNDLISICKKNVLDKSSVVTTESQMELGMPIASDNSCNDILFSATLKSFSRSGMVSLVCIVHSSFQRYR